MKLALHRIKQWIVAPIIYRSLFRGFIQQELQGRYAGSMGGLIWSVLTPLSTILIYIYVFSVIMKIRILSVETGTDQFVIYLLTGLFPWMAFSEALSRSTSLLLDKAALITKVSFPVEILPAVGTASPFILNGIGFGVFLLYLIIEGYFHVFWLLLPVVIITHMLFTAGLVAFLSAICIFVRDIQQVVGVLVSVWFFLTPIIYPISLVPEGFKQWVILNPMYVFIELYRHILLQHNLPVELALAAVALSGVSFIGGGWFFIRIKHSFGDVL